MKRRIGLCIACLGIVAAAVIGAPAAHKTDALGTIKPTTVLHGGEGGWVADAIKPFRVHFPAEALADLKRRIAATRWPDKEIVTDQSQGVQLATIQKLARYWATDYNWRKVEAKLNALPQFITEIDGVDIHFIHVRSKHPNALPVIVTHGWPGSIIEQLKIIDPLTNPTAHGGSASDAFDVVIPSLPGYGFSGKPTSTGWDPIRIARAWVVLMKRLGYTRYVAQGGDWGNAVTEQMALLAAAGIDRHSHQHACHRASRHRQGGSCRCPAPAGLSADEKHAYDQLAFFYKHGLGYAQEMANRPQTLYGIGDSPVGLAAWMLDHDARSSGAHRARLRRSVRRPDAGRRPRQRHALLADEHGGLFGAAVLGKQARLLRPEERPDPGCRERLSGRALSGPAELDARRPIPSSFTTTGSTRAATSPRGSSRNSSPPNSGRLPFTAGREGLLHRSEMRWPTTSTRSPPLLGMAAATVAGARLGRQHGAGAIGTEPPGEKHSFGTEADRRRRSERRIRRSRPCRWSGLSFFFTAGLYDIHSYVDVAPLLAAAGYRVIVPYLRGYGTTRFLSHDAPERTAGRSRRRHHRV